MSRAQRHSVLFVQVGDIDPVRARRAADHAVQRRGPRDIRHLAQGADRNAQGVGVARSRVARDLSRGSAAGRILAHAARPLVGRGVRASHAVGDGEFFGGGADPMMPRVQSHSLCYCSLRRKSFYSPPSLCIIFFCE